MRNLKTVLGLVVMAVFSIAVNAQELPKPSPHATFTQRVGVTDIFMDYSRPAVRGREIWGELVPFDKVWRAGANASTKIEFSTDVKIGGKDVKAGKYAIYIIPNPDEFTFIISSYIDGWGVGDYTEATDVVRVKSPVERNQMGQENMLFSIDKITNNSCVLNLTWGNVKTGFDISMNTNEFAQEILKESVKKADGSFSVYNKAASYLLENDGDKAEALALAIKSTNLQKKFWNMTVLAEAYYANGETKMAIISAKEALEMSEKAKYDSYIKRNKENLAAWSKK
jgi:hypothetical protein